MWNIVHCLWPVSSSLITFYYAYFFLFVVLLFANVCKRKTVAKYKERVKVKVKVTLVQALRLCTGRTAHRGGVEV